MSVRPLAFAILLATAALAAATARAQSTDPARHSPGLAELRAGAARLRVAHDELPDGAQVRFETADPGLVTAVHRWFGAQLSEHGADARAE